MIIHGSQLAKGNAPRIKRRVGNIKLCQFSFCSSSKKGQDLSTVLQRDQVVLREDSFISIKIIVNVLNRYEENLNL